VLTFAYFSTEWDMIQPFTCQCGTSRCLGAITGAKDIDSRVLECVLSQRIHMMRVLQKSFISGYFLNDHIREMLKRRKPNDTRRNAC
jgi:hypothetical protein